MPGAASLLVREQRRWSSSPHPSIERRGSWSGCWVWLQANCGREGGGGGGRKRGGCTKVNCDGVDGGLKLRLPSQITLDMSTRVPDNKIKSCIFS